MPLFVLSVYCVQAQISNADTNYTTRISSIEWMADGKAILLGIVKHHKTDEQAPFFSKVFLYDIQSGQLKFLFDDGSNLAASPDGKKIIFLKRSDKKRQDIRFYDIGSGKETVLKTDTMRKYGLDWSPNGKYLVYNILRGPDKPVDIFVMELSTKKITQVTNSGSDKSFDPIWSPDSKHIVYYLEKGDRHDQIWLTDRTGDFHTNLTNDTTTHNFFPSWFDQNTIIYTQSPSQLIMMSANGSNRKIIEGINATPVKCNSNAGKFVYVKSEEENKLVIYDWKNKTASEVLDGTKLMSLFN
jgi:Tol biopolymer transport system component